MECLCDQSLLPLFRDHPSSVLLPAQPCSDSPATPVLPPVQWRRLCSRIAPAGCCAHPMRPSVRNHAAARLPTGAPVPLSRQCVALLASACVASLSSFCRFPGTCMRALITLVRAESKHPAQHLPPRCHRRHRPFACCVSCRLLACWQPPRPYAAALTLQLTPVLCLQSKPTQTASPPCRSRLPRAAEMSRRCVPPLRRRLLPPPTGTAAAYAIHVLLICAVCCLLLMFVQELEEAFRIFDWRAYNERFDVSIARTPSSRPAAPAHRPPAGRPIAACSAADIGIVSCDAAPLPLIAQSWLLPRLRRCPGEARRRRWA